MTGKVPTILFVDNTVSRIFSTVQQLPPGLGTTSILHDESELREMLGKGRPEIIFLHLDLQPNDAIQLLTDIRRRHLSGDAFIVIYSDKQDDYIQELALQRGADAFISFHNKPALLGLFIRSLLRLRTARRNPRQKKLIVDSERFVIVYNNQDFVLPVKEFRIFSMLFSKSGEFVSKEEIAEAVWGKKAVAETRAIDVHIFAIRKRMGREVIQTKRKRVTGSIPGC